MLPVSLRIEREGNIKVYLRDAETATEVDDEVILDVDHSGHWIRGIEIIGGVAFDLARAVRPFNPKRPREAGRHGVSYDADANAAFFYIEMRPLHAGSAATYSHSITPPARFGLDKQGGLIWISFSSKEGNESVEDFLALLDARVQRAKQ
jgi:uncharacterized protein YuzE